MPVRLPRVEEDVDYYLGGFEGTPEQRLIAAVIEQAVRDATRGHHTELCRQADSREASRWLLSISTTKWSFFWCSSKISEDPRELMRKLREALLCKPSQPSGRRGRA